MFYVPKVAACSMTLLGVIAVSAYAGDRLLDPRDRPSAEASDRVDALDSPRRTEDPAQQAAREILEQRGSIVDGLRDRFEPPAQAHAGWPNPPDGYRRATDSLQPASPGWPHQAGFQQPAVGSSPETNKVTSLRTAAWQLDTTAHRLEGIDLYEQADALREVAGRLRKDARKIKQSISSEKRKP